MFQSSCDVECFTVLYLYIIKEVAKDPGGTQRVDSGNRSGYCKETAQKLYVVKHIFSADYGEY